MYPEVEGSFDARPTSCITIQCHKPDFHNINLHTAVETSHLIQRQTKQSDMYFHILLRVTDSLSAAMVLKGSSNDPEEDYEQGRVDGKNTAHNMLLTNASRSYCVCLCNSSKPRELLAKEVKRHK